MVASLTAHRPFKSSSFAQKTPPQGGPGHDNHGGGVQHPGGGFNNNGGDNGGHNVPQPPMPHPQPVNPGNHGGNDNNHGGFPGNNDWDHQHPQPYHGPVNECTDFTFKADTPNPFSGKIYFYDYQGQQVTFDLKIMRLPKDVQNLPPQELINALKETNISVTYPVSSQYQVQLFDQALPGTYMGTVNYVRGGASLSQMFTFAI